MTTAPKATYSDHLAATLGEDPEALLHMFRQQLDRVRDAGVTVATIKADLSRLQAAHATRGNSSHWDHGRKALIATLVERRRVQAAAAGEKITEAALDSHARSHPDYAAFLADGHAQAIAYEQEQARLSDAFALLEHEKGVLEYLRERLALMRAMVFAHGQEARLQG